jgi:YgiT-type zinc finger domain-containing protein
MQCPACATEAMTFKSIDKTIGQGAMAVPLTGLKAHVCASCGEFVLDARSYRRWAAAQDQYVAARASERMQCGSCGFKTTEFKTFDQTLGRGRNAVVLQGLSGQVCAHCGDAVLDADSYRRLVAAQEQYVAAARAGETRRVAN